MSWLQNVIDRARDFIAPPPPSETRAIQSTSFDRDDFRRVMDSIPAVQQDVAELGQKIDYVEDFAADLHAMFYKVNPTLNGRSDMVESRVANRDVIEQMLGLPEVDHLRQYTAGDTYSTAMAMTSIKDKALEVAGAAYEAAEQAAEAEREAQQQAAEHAERMQALLDAMDSTDNERSQEWLAEQLQAEADQFAEAQGQAQQAHADAQQQARSATASYQHELRSAAKEVEEQLAEEEALASAFGVEPGELKKMPVQERMALAQRLRNNRLADFAKLIGAFRTVQQAESRKRVVNAATEIHGVTVGNQIERILPGEYLNFAHPVLETLMWTRFASGQLNVYDVRGKERQGQGPIICVVDESGSMATADVAGGTREAWSKALALALLDQARRRKRDFVYIGFGSAAQQHVVEFPGGVADIDKVLTMTEHFFSGGTHYEKPLTLALDIIERQFSDDKGRPDIVFISDDEYTAGIPEAFLAKYRKVKEKASIQTYGIAVGCRVGGAMKALSDNVRAITELVSDPRNVGDIFRTI